MGRRKPSADQPFHSLPLDASLLAPPSKRVMPEVTHREAKVSQRVTISRHSVSIGYAHPQLTSTTCRLRNRVMHAPPQLDLHPLSLLAFVCESSAEAPRTFPSSSFRRYA